MNKDIKQSDSESKVEVSQVNDIPSNENKIKEGDQNPKSLAPTSEKGSNLKNTETSTSSNAIKKQEPIDTTQVYQNHSDVNITTAPIIASAYIPSHYYPPYMTGINNNVPYNMNQQNWTQTSANGTTPIVMDPVTLAAYMSATNGLYPDLSSHQYDHINFGFTPSYGFTYPNNDFMNSVQGTVPSNWKQGIQTTDALSSSSSNNSLPKNNKRQMSTHNNINIQTGINDLTNLSQISPSNSYGQYRNRQNKNQNSYRHQQNQRFNNNNNNNNIRNFEYNNFTNNNDNNHQNINGQMPYPPNYSLNSYNNYNNIENSMNTLNINYRNSSYRGNKSGPGIQHTYNKFNQKSTNQIYQTTNDFEKINSLNEQNTIPISNNLQSPDTNITNPETENNSQSNNSWASIVRNVDSKKNSNDLPKGPLDSKNIPNFQVESPVLKENKQMYLNEKSGDYQPPFNSSLNFNAHSFPPISEANGINI
jgi:hypothetical protein